MNRVVDQPLFDFWIEKFWSIQSFGNRSTTTFMKNLKLYGWALRVNANTISQSSGVTEFVVIYKWVLASIEVNAM